jgi:alcohol dehydrogenase class IV
MAKSSKGKSKIKVPKRVAGVKIPKAVRKGPVVDFVNSSAGRLLVAQALTAAVAAFAIKESDSPAGERIRTGARSAEETVKENTARLGHAFAEGVRAFREALGNPDADADTGVEAETVDEIVAKKKSRAASQRHPTMPGGL